MKEEIIQTLQGKIFALKKDDPTFEARKEYFESKMVEELDAVESFEKSKNKRKTKKKDIDEKIKECLDRRKTKIIVEFIDRESASIKSFAVKNRGNTEVTSGFMSGKLFIEDKTFIEEFHL